MKKNIIKDFTKNKRVLGVLLAAAVSTSVFAGCGNKKVDDAHNSGHNDTASQTSVDNNKEEKVRKVIVGSGNGYKPYAYLDEDGNAVGYEYDVLHEIDELLPQYEFEYKVSDFDNIVLSLDAGKIDLAAHQYEYTPERAEKYLFSEESYTTYVTYITVLGDVNDVNSLSDLKGKKIEGGGTTSATNQILTKWNEEHPDEAVEIVNHSGQTTEEGIAQLRSGAVAATVSTKRDTERRNEIAGDKNFSKAVGEPINNSKTYYLYRKDDVELQKAVDGALKTLKENGKLAELSEKWLGGDFTGDEE